MVTSLAEAYVVPDHAWPRLIYVGERLVGFVMGFLDMPWDPDDNADDLSCGVWRPNVAGRRRPRDVRLQAGLPADR